MRILWIACSAILLVFLTGELFARLALGLGTPPLSVAHPKIEYMFAPDQDVSRFGNRQIYNAHGMRSGPIDPDRKLVLALGDSVLNGGNLTDHARLATTLASNDKIQFGNASAGSWGPPNALAWLEEYGSFHASQLILVLSSHDLQDAPTFDPLDPNTHPTRRPISALVEGITRYGPRFLPMPTRERTSASVAARGDTRPSLERLNALAAERGQSLCIVLHRTRTELRDDADPFGPIRDIFEGDKILDLESYMPDAAIDPGRYYRDDIHLTDAGQASLSRALIDCLETP